MKQHIYTPINLNNNPPQLSKYGLADDVFTIIDAGDGFCLDTKIVFTDSTVGEQPEVTVFLKINNNTSKILFFTNTSWTQNITKFYHIIHDPEAILLDYSSNRIGLVEYSYNSDTQILTSNIISMGKFTASKYMFDKQLWQIYQGDSIDSSTLNPIIQQNNESDSFINNIIGYSVKNLDVLYSGSGYKLNSTFYLQRSSFTKDLLPADCEVSARLCLCSNTVVISGGANYKIGDTFTVNNIDQPSGSGLIRVTAVNSLGAITATEVINRGFNFTSLPTVTDNNGSSVTVFVNDSFGVGSCEVLSGGNGYLKYDNRIGCKFNNIEYSPTSIASTITYINKLNIVPLLSNNFSLDSIFVNIPGNNVSEVNFNLITNKTIINNQYISVNKNNLIKIKNLDFPNRPRFFI